MRKIFLVLFACLLFQMPVQAAEFEDLVDRREEPSEDRVLYFLKEQTYSSYEEAIEKLSSLVLDVALRREKMDVDLQVPIAIKTEKVPELEEGEWNAFQKTVDKEVHKEETKNPEAGHNLKMEGNISYSGELVYEDGTYKGNIGVGVTYKTPHNLYRQYQQEVKSILDGLNLDGKSDYEKCCRIVEWMGDSIAYEDAGNAPGSYAVRALTQKKETCMGWAGLFYYMGTSAGLDVLYDRGLNGYQGHAWNLVKLDGEYYYIDTIENDFTDGKPDWDIFLGKEELPYRSETDLNKNFPIAPNMYSKEHSACKGNHDLWKSGAFGGCYPGDRYSCKNCLYEKDVPNGTETHDYDEGVITPATCTTPEIKTYTCQSRGQYTCWNSTKVEELSPALGHQFEEKTVEATCDAPAYWEKVCTRCKEKETKELAPALGHDYEETRTEPDCQKAGEVLYTCKRCPKSYTEILPKVDHAYEVTSQPATCTEKELLTYTCKYCKTFYEEYGKAALGHQFKEENKTQPSCEQEGKIYYRCSACGETREETIPQTGHQDFEVREKKEATCTETGFTGNTYCKECNALIKKGEELPMLNHDFYEGKTVKEPTYYEEGLLRYTCRTCKATKEETLPVLKHPHSVFREKVTREPTCKDTGIITVSCLSCDYFYEKEIPKTGHGPGKITGTKQPTCTAPGYTGDTVCKECGTLLAAGEVLPVKGHQFNSGKVTRAATCKTPGIKTYSCSCGASKTETIPVTGVHSWKTTTKAPTCTANGSKTNTCTVCKKTSTQALSKTGHRYGGWKKVSAATVFKQARRKHTCASCRKTETVSYGSKVRPTIKTNASSLKLKRRQSTSKFKVTMAKGDTVKSWKSSNKKIVTVSGKSNGTCKIKAGSRSGRAKITITLKSGKKKTISVTVQKSTVTTSSVKGIPKKITLKRGKKYTLKPSIAPITSTSRTTYKSANKRYASVSSKGVIKGVRKGKTKITVQSGKKKVTCTVTVK